jgi:hypothetical protein
MEIIDGDIIATKKLLVVAVNMTQGSRVILTPRQNIIMVIEKISIGDRFPTETPVFSNKVYCSFFILKDLNRGPTVGMLFRKRSCRPMGKSKKCLFVLGPFWGGTKLHTK